MARSMRERVRTMVKKMFQLVEHQFGSATPDEEPLHRRQIALCRCVP